MADDAFSSCSDFLPLFAHLPMKAPGDHPGPTTTRATLLLGLAVERAAGMPFIDYVERHVMQASGMT